MYGENLRELQDFQLPASGPCAGTAENSVGTYGRFHYSSYDSEFPMLVSGEW
jgi:hypothetical protein